MAEQMLSSTVGSAVSNQHSTGLSSFCATPWTAAHQAPLSSTVSWSLLKFMSIESVMLYNHLILFHPLLFPHHPLLPSIFLNNQGLFQ